MKFKIEPEICIDVDGTRYGFYALSDEPKEYGVAYTLSYFGHSSPNVADPELTKLFESFKENIEQYPLSDTQPIPVVG